MDLTICKVYTTIFSHVFDLAKICMAKTFLSFSNGLEQQQKIHVALKSWGQSIPKCKQQILQQGNNNINKTIRNVDLLCKGP